MIEGRYTGLRAIEREDLPQLLVWRNHPDLRRFFREYRELSSDHQKAWYENVALNDSGTRMFAIVELETGNLLGACGLCYINWVNRNADFSIYLGAEGMYIDETLAPDAARVMIRYGFEELNLHRLWAEIYDIDTPKIKLFNTLGFTQEGRHRQTHWTENRWADSLFFSLLSTDEITLSV